MRTLWPILIIISLIQVKSLYWRPKYESDIFEMQGSEKNLQLLCSTIFGFLLLWSPIWISLQKKLAYFGKYLVNRVRRGQMWPCNLINILYAFSAPVFNKTTVWQGALHPEISDQGLDKMSLGVHVASSCAHVKFYGWPLQWTQCIWS